MTIDFKKEWVGRTFECLDTGTSVTLNNKMVKPRAFITIGNGAIDLGDGFYSRWLGRIVEVKNER